MDQDYSPVRINTRRSIREIPLPSTRKRKAVTPKPRVPDFYQQRRRPVRPFVFLGILIVLGVLVVLIMNIFATVSVTITPKKANASVNTGLVISTSTESNADLIAEVVNKTVEKSVVLPSDGKQQVSEKASGKIIIYNSFSTKPQRLIRRTRFESSSGLIYRIDESIDVPGMKGDVPGSIEAIVYAEEAGDKYNLKESTFKVPGFVGTPQYAGFSAKTVTPITGGFVGTRNVVSDSAKKAATEQLKTSIENELNTLIDTEIGENKIVIPDSSVTKYSQVKEESEGDSLKISLSGTLSTSILSKSNIASALAKRSIPGSTDMGISIVNLDQIKTSIEKSSTTVMKFDGQAIFEWNIDEVKIKEMLINKPISQKNEIFSSIPAVYQVSTKSNPFWIGRFPKDPDRIKVIIEHALDS